MSETIPVQQPDAGSKESQKTKRKKRGPKQSAADVRLQAIKSLSEAPARFILVYETPEGECSTLVSWN